LTPKLGLAKEFFKRHGFKHVALLSADGALEAMPSVGSATCGTRSHWSPFVADSAIH
jgi:hypothetical protein